MANPELDLLPFEALFRQGSALLQRGLATEAQPLLERAYELEPDDADIALNLSGAYILAGRFRKAVPILERLVEAAPNNPAAWLNLGAAYLGNPILARPAEQVRAIEAFERALALNPAAPHAAYNIGLIYRDRSEIERAIHWFQQALRANPADMDARRLLERLAAPAAEEE
ncbi:MAG: tetratricopeptide repeat protein [Candidatus Promineifilaceae bacterium]